MRHPWLLAVATLLLVLLGTHAPSLPEAWRGEIAYSYAFDRCQGHFVSEAAPGPRPRPGAEGCDTIYSQRMGWDGWRRAVEHWQTRENVFTFLFVDLWTVATDARALNVLDLLLFMWPARFFFETPAAGLAALHLGMLVVGALSGVIFARALGASPLAAVAAGVVTGASGIVIESTQRGQYPQAAIIGALLFFAGMVRIVKGERHGVVLAGGGAALAALLYWQNGVILGFGAIVFLIGARIAGPFAPGTTKRLVAGAVLSVAIAAIPAVPVVEAILEGSESKMEVEPYGTAFPYDSTEMDELVDLIDEVPWFELFSPRSGWIPVLPLLPLALVGLANRKSAPWTLLALVGAVLALGPLPAVPDGWGFRQVEGFGAMDRTRNPFYELVYQWFPTASRQRHPMRWATLLTVAMAAATIYGVDRLRHRWPDHVLLAVLTGLGWAAWVGPWPLRQADFPQETVVAFSRCTELILPRIPGGERDLDDVHRLEGLLWLPRSPARSKGSGGVGKPTKEMQRWSEPFEAQMKTIMGAQARPDPDPLAGRCVIFEESWYGKDSARVRSRLAAAFGEEPTFSVTPTDLFAADGTTRRVEVWVPSVKPIPYVRPADVAHPTTVVGESVREPASHSADGPSLAGSAPSDTTTPGVGGGAPAGSAPAVPTATVSAPVTVPSVR